MNYDATKLRVLRDNIDAYLSKANQDDQRIYEALEQSISSAVAEGMKPVVEELKAYIDSVAAVDKPKEQD